MRDVVRDPSSKYTKVQFSVGVKPTSAVGTKLMQRRFRGLAQAFRNTNCANVGNWANVGKWANVG